MSTINNRLSNFPPFPDKFDFGPSNEAQLLIAGRLLSMIDIKAET